MAPRKITPVKDNNDKAKTYTEHMKKYNRAMKSECYFEAFLITYAMLEDRLRSYLYYLGCLKSRNSYKFDNETIRNNIRYLVDNYSGEKVSNLGITSITGKMRIVKSVHTWFQSGCPNPDESAYLNELASVIDIYDDSQEILDILTQLKDWCDYRNEIIHALLNKSLDSLYTNLSQRTEEGMALARTIDNHVRRLKSRNKIRKFLKLKDN